MKICSICNKEKDYLQFYKNKSKKDGYSFDCKLCRKEYFCKSKNVRKDYLERNKERIKEWRKNNSKINKEKNPLYKLQCNLRSLISKSITRQGYRKTSKSKEILGCDYIELKQHLESKFTEGMNWDNYGKWHIDHIYPSSLAETEEEIIRLNHFTNLQPLWAEDNIRKGNKLWN
jgi:hypothetical protein